VSDGCSSSHQAVAGLKRSAIHSIIDVTDAGDGHPVRTRVRAYADIRRLATD
jgi:hypothetical protein